VALADLVRYQLGVWSLGQTFFEDSIRVNVRCTKKTVARLLIVAAWIAVIAIAFATLTHVGFVHAIYFKLSPMLMHPSILPTRTLYTSWHLRLWGRSSRWLTRGDRYWSVALSSVPQSGLEVQTATAQ
jgi:hypothetical protein